MAPGSRCIMAVARGGVSRCRTCYGEWPTSPANVSTPLSGIWYGLVHLTGRYGRPAAVNVVGMLSVVLQIGLCGLLVFRRPQPLTAAIALAGIALAVLGGPAV